MWVTESISSQVNGSNRGFDQPKNWTPWELLMTLIALNMSHDFNVLIFYMSLDWLFWYCTCHVTVLILCMSCDCSDIIHVTWQFWYCKCHVTVLIIYMSCDCFDIVHVTWLDYSSILHASWLILLILYMSRDSSDIAHVTRLF